MPRLTELIPLRTTTALGEYTDIQALPRIAGHAILSPVRYDKSGHLWLICDAPIEGIDWVEHKGQRITAWALQQDVDPTGRAVSVLETQVQVEAPADLRIKVRGELHPQTGEPLDRPDLQIWWLLSEVCGYPIEPAELDELRAWCQTHNVRTGGVVDDHNTTKQTWVGRICAGSGLRWSRDLPGWAIPWPPESRQAVATITAAQAPRLSAQTNARNLITELEVLFDYDNSTGKHLGSITVESQQAKDRYGAQSAQIKTGWVRNLRTAQAYAERYLGYHARPLWASSGSVSHVQAVLGDWIEIDHPYCPPSTALLVGRHHGDTPDETWTLQAPAGAVPEVQIKRISQGVLADALATEVKIQADTAEIKITDPDGQILPGARVIVDGAKTYTANSAGWIYLPADQQEHLLLIQARGYADQTLKVFLG